MKELKKTAFGLVAIGLTALFAFTGCGRKTANSITVAGSTAFQTFAEKLADQFMAKRPDVRITVQGGGSALGIQTALSGTAQIGMADLVKLPPEAGALTSITVARDGIAIIVNQGNAVTNLATDQIRGIFNGTITNWKMVGGEEKPIRVISREAGSGTRTSFEQILGSFRLVKDAIVQPSNGTIRETVANDKDAVGYLSHGLLTDKVKAVSVDGVECTGKEITAGQYNLVRPVFLLTKGPQEGAAKDFIDYILSDEGQETIKQDGLLPAR